MTCGIIGGARMTRRPTPFKLLLAAVLLIDLAAVDVHEMAIRPAGCHGAMEPVPHGAVAR